MLKKQNQPIFFSNHMGTIENKTELTRPHLIELPGKALILDLLAVQHHNNRQYVTDSHVKKHSGIN